MATGGRRRRRARPSQLDADDGVPAHLVSQVDAVRPGDLLEVVDEIRWLPQIHSWSGKKVFWIVGLLGLAASTGLLARRRPQLLARPRRLVSIGAAAAVVVVTATAVAAREPGCYDANVFEAAYFVSQPTRPDDVRRTVAPGEDVWTLIWAFPGFLEPGRYVATANGVEGQGRLAVRVDGETVAGGAAGDGRSDLRGQPFRLGGGFIRLDLVASDGPVSLDGVTVEPAG